MGDPDRDPRAPLKIDRDDLFMAAESRDELVQNYLDRKTGHLVMRSDDLAEADEEGGHPEPEWSREQRELNRLIDENTEGRFVPVEPVETHEAYRWMEEFAGTVSDPRLGRDLAIALDGKGAFRRFKDALLDYLEERRRWFAFHEARLEVHVREWLDSLDISYELPGKRPLADESRS